MSRNMATSASVEQPANRGAPGRRPGEAAAAYIRRLLAQGWLSPVKRPVRHGWTWEV